MTKTIAITGGTGSQGGGVANVMLKTPGWKVRVITRNASSEKAKALVAQGAEVVEANLDDEDSLAKAFESCNAIFGVTNFWEHLFTGKSQAESGEAEEEQAMKLARAAAKTTTLEHYVWSTLPSSKKLTNNKIAVPHLDYKANVDDRIKTELPELAMKTTFLFFGYYPSNIASFPLIKPFEYPGAYGKWIQMLPTPAESTIPVSGDMIVTPGIWVRQILALPEKTLGKYSIVAPEILSFGEMMKIWSEVTGRPGVYVQCSKEAYEEIWGLPGNEMAMQLKFGEEITDWMANFDWVNMEELGIKKEEVPGCKMALEGLKTLL
ncbi:NAD(P)-binding protein [Lindgomyces ingoldianus]|uniref:NAD(P)-binding protein n=1 Tax=Lindgomyces ingoldianus TaxID=673940 RepID=A0ACB6QVX2_9PLEO|nr:NAD(P)-binding protein [Lindgomyces ingoldianus]KAF2471148.1 NAD(P)-binding protein [Lindgomyces ingoldianus]